jgi:hypothetical protein
VPYNNSTFPKAEEWISPSNGGTISSNDNIVSLRIPANPTGFTVYTSVSVLDSQAPNSQSATYRVNISTTSSTSNNVVLPAPATLEFGFDSSDVVPANLALASQDNTGVWSINTNTQLKLSSASSNTSSGRVEIQVTKGGDYALVEKYKLYPKRGSVKINGKVNLTVIQLEAASGTGFMPITVTPITSSGWAVNGLANGNDAVGKLLADSSNPNQRVYLAPATKPSPNPVTVSTTITSGTGTTTLISQIRVENSKGWVEVWSEGSASKTWQSTSRIGSLKVKGFANLMLDATEVSASAPQVVFGNAVPGILSSNLKIRTGSTNTGVGSVEYTMREYEECICTPNDGTAIVDTTYTFTATGELKPALGNFSFVLGEINPIGQYNLTLANGEYALEGEFRYNRKETYPCGDRAAEPEVVSFGADRMIFRTSSALKQVGSVKPKGPDRMRGMAYDHKTYSIVLPSKEIEFSPIPATSVFSWYFTYEPSSQGAGLRQSPPAFTSPALPNAEEAAGIKPQPRC